MKESDDLFRGSDAQDVAEGVNCGMRRLPPGPEWLTLPVFARGQALRDTIVIMGLVLCQWLIIDMWYFEGPGARIPDPLLSWFLPNLICNCLLAGVLYFLTLPARVEARLRVHNGDPAGEAVAGATLAVLPIVATGLWVGFWWVIAQIQGPDFDVVDTDGEASRTAWQSISKATTLFLVTAVALPEELIFRGLLLPRLRVLTGSWWVAIPINALAFGAWHVNGGLWVVLQVAFVSIAICFVVLRTRSLLAVMISHAIYNCVQALAPEWWTGAWNDGGG